MSAPAIGLAVALTGALAVPQEPDAPRLERIQSLRLQAPVSAWRLLDLDGDGTVELLTVSRDGRVAVRRAGENGLLPAEVKGGVAIEDPERTLLALAPIASDGGVDPGGSVDGGGGVELFVVGPSGVRRHAFVEGSFDPAGRPVAEGARSTFRTGSPRFAPLASDVNGDGRVDLVLPSGSGVDLWVGGEGDAFEKTAHVPVQVWHRQGSEAALLTDVLSERLRIPGLVARDVNGDGRVDLVVTEEERRSYHLQAADGSFPMDPTVVLDLGIFRDTTPEAKLAPGQTLVLDDGAVLRSAELNGDGVLDHVIAHRRKVWIFPGTTEGPQFTEPSRILKTAEDVTTLALVELDDDGRPDLLVVKLVVPSLGSLMVGLLTDWDVTITALGYKNTGDGGFGKRPAMQTELVLRLPPLVDLLKRPEDVVSQIEDAESRSRPAVTGDFDGDGVGDVALIGAEAQEIELWRTPPEAAEIDGVSDGVWLRRLLFDEDRQVFDVDRVAALLGTYGDRRTTRLTGGRTSDVSLMLGEGTGLPLAAALPADLDGDGRDEIVLGYEGAGGLLVLEVLAYRQP